ncbi:sugar kinase [Oceanicola granulosus]|nr:sugar kinase [Oceanicola granulosus]
MKRFVCVGEAMIELSGDETRGWALGVAGDTLNTAWYARQALGDDWRIDYVTRIGTDRFSERIAAFCEAENIGTRHVSRDPMRGAGLYAISLDADGERSFTYWRGESAARHLADEALALDAAFDGADMIYFSGITLAILAPDARARLLERIDSSGAPCAFDTNYRPRLWETAGAAREWITRAATVARIVLPSADDDAACFNDAHAHATADRYATLGVPEVVVKSGGGALHLRFDNDAFVIDDLPRVTPVDTTGAGDSFSAGYLAARLTGANCLDAARAGHDVAMRAVQGPGALVRMENGQ